MVSFIFFIEIKFISGFFFVSECFLMKVIQVDGKYCVWRVKNSEFYSYVKT